MQAETVGLPVLPPLDARIPTWSLDKLELRQCPLCRSNNHPSLARPDRLGIAFCGKCQLWYVSCLPCLEEIRKLYQGYWFSFRPKDLSKSYATRLQSDMALGKNDIRLNRLSALCKGLEGKQLLEIGCGCGELLVTARHRGSAVVGNDISQEACSFVRDLLQIPVCPGELCDSQFTSQFGQMDVVVMSDLIEHPVEPLRTLESALNVLKPGGLLLILTPNGGEASDNLQCAKEWVGFRVDLEHLQYLSAATIFTLAYRYDCRIEHLETFGYPWLEGIDRLPTESGAALQSVKDRIRAKFRKSNLARRSVRAIHAFLNTTREEQRDPRLGTYHLITILRKMGSGREIP